VGVTNHVEYRPLEGFVLAVTPFNVTSMNNLAFGPALLGNTVAWKPAESASLVAYLSLQLLREAGLPSGVVNLVHGDGAESGAVALAHRDLAAVHFTGSTPTFRHIWRTVGENTGRYRDYPRASGRPAARISSSPTLPLTSRHWPSPASAAPTVTRARSVPRRPASTSRGACGRRCATSWST
jgi:1-pyrroline-5-carboxylate dehydrogenase